MTRKRDEKGRFVASDTEPDQLRGLTKLERMAHKRRGDHVE